ncbi:MAG: hypothetical protein WAT39_26355, partial [Planctomycetota bacterium]
VPPAPTPPPPAPARPSSVVEFADEVVEVRKPVAKPEPATAASGKAAAGPAIAATSSRILQFQKKTGGPGGLLGDDFGQLSGGMRGLLVLGVLALGAGIVFVVAQLMK